ncbi:MAG TPA: hypothetical protein DCY13_12915, partial [Verrucomicrobiales bacterium]|nr:hypothetical protein [Verrucomicrobiales bacterium]
DANQPCLFDYLSPHASRQVAGLLQQGERRPETLTGVRLLIQQRSPQMVDLQVTPLDDVYSLVMIRDISRRWRMESHAQRLMTAVDATPDVIFLTDADFRITFVNSAFQMVTGYTIEDALGQVADFLRAPGQEAVQKACREHLANDVDWSGEMLNRRVDGNHYPVQTSVSPIFDLEGAKLGYAVFERDITLLKRLQEDLRRERNAVTSIIDSLDAAIYTLDSNFKLAHVNSFWERLPVRHGWLAWDEKPRPGASFLEAIPDANRREQIRAALNQVLTDGRTFEMQAPDPLQRRQWFVRIAPWRHEGRIMGLIYKVTDQTRLTELQNQLYQAQKMETVGALAAGVAHDFNNLLQAIRGHVALMLMEEALPETLGSPLQQIDQAATRACEITQQLLTFSRASEENQVVLDFNLVINEAAQLARRSLKQKITLKLEPSAEPVHARIDATRAQQLLLNLCVNAIDAMPNGGVLTLSNRVARLTPAQAARHSLVTGAPYVCCTVRDTGTGIPPEIVDRIFDPFFTTKAKGKGTGLGMSIVHGVISHSGGFLELDTELNRGTAFNIYLPQVAVTTAASSSKSPDRKLVRGTGRVLVVDDLDLVRDFARTFLEASGYTVETAASGEEALEILAAVAKPFDLVLTDFNMTGISGQQLIREITERWPSTKCILASGYLEPQERDLVEEHLGARILNKPFNVREAANLIAEMLAS